MSYYDRLSQICEQNEKIAQDTVKIAQALGADEVAVSIFAGQGTEVSARHNEVEMIEFSRDSSLSLIVYKGKRAGSASTSDLSPESLKATAEAAYALCEFTAADECAGLPDKEDLFVGEMPDFNQLFPNVEDADVLAECAVRLDRAANELVKNTEGLKDSDGSSVDCDFTVRTLANSLDFTGSVTVSRCSKGIGLVGEKDGIMQRAGSDSFSCCFGDLMSDEDLLEEAKSRTLNKLGARRIPTGVYPVIYSERMAAGFFRHFERAIAGSAVYKDSSFLAGKLNESIFPEFLNIREDPHLAGSFRSAPFDSNGVRTEKLDLVRNGILCNYLLGTYSARKLNMRCNGHNGSSFTTFVEADREHTLSFEEMLKKAGCGIVVESLIGQGVDGVSGNYSRGAGGYYFEDGKRKYAVDEITVAGNLKDMFASIAAVGDKTDSRLAVRTGCILFPELSVSGS